MLNIEDFEILELPETLAGVDKTLLWNAYDIAAKWGHVDTENMHIYFMHRMADRRLLRIILSMTEKSALSVLAASSPFTLSIPIKNERIVWWDFLLSPLDAKEACQEIDLFGLSAGMVDGRTKERKLRLNFEKPIPRTKPGETFSAEYWERLMEQP